LCLFFAGTWADGAEPALRSDVKVIDFEVGDYLKTKWTLQPELNPDVFTLPEYRTEQEVRFTTGTNSLSFAVRPGETHNLTVELGDGEPCRIAIVAPPTPPLLGNERGILVVVGFAAVAFSAYWPRRFIPLAALLSCGWMAPLSFWTLTIIGGLIHGHYNHLRMVVSELGAIGARSELFMSGGEVFVGVTCLLLSAGIHRASRERGLTVLPALCTLAMPVSMAWAAVFPMHHELHGALGPLSLLLNVGAFLAFLLWRRPDVGRIRWLSLAAFGLMDLIFLRFVPEIEANYPGLVQRFYYAGWSVWAICLGWGFLAGAGTASPGAHGVVQPGGQMPAALSRWTARWRYGQETGQTRAWSICKVEKRQPATWHYLVRRGLAIAAHRRLT
jgi:Protein of unknown function (DUF998)